MKKRVGVGGIILISTMIFSCSSREGESNLQRTDIKSGKVLEGQKISDNYSPSDVDVTPFNSLSVQQLQELSSPDQKTREQPTPPIPLKYPESDAGTLKKMQVDLIDNHGVTGIYLNTGKGVWEGHSAWTTMNLPSATTPEGNRIYAPTLLPNGYSCLEVLSAYWNTPTQTSTVGQFWVWNHCNSASRYAYNRKLNDSSWTSNYVRNTASGVPRYYAGVYKSGTNTWVAILWNYNTASWENIFTQAGTNPLPQTYRGWSMWEAYFHRTSPPCPIYNSTVYAWSPKIMNTSGNWVDVTDADTSRAVFYYDCAENGTYFHRIYNAGTTTIEHWEASNYR